MSQGKNTGKGVQYKFNSKKMTNPQGILKMSAILEGTKASTASLEVMIRLKMFSQHAKKEDVEDCLLEYMNNLLGMGYTLEWRLKILTGTMKGLRRENRHPQECKVNNGLRPRNQKTSRLEVAKSLVARRT